MGLLEKYINPQEEKWDALLNRPTQEDQRIKAAVETVMKEVKERGDAAVKEYTRRFDGVEVENFSVAVKDYVKGSTDLQEKLFPLLETAGRNIRHFHEANKPQDGQVVETQKGVHCWRRWKPIEKVGIYVPGGSAPLFSSLLMLAIPARIARCSEIVICTPPTKRGGPHPVIALTAKFMGFKNIYTIGGSQAIAALTFGTESVPAVYKIFGPGNAFVTEAKILAQQHGIAIDMPAGPTEVLVIADQKADPAFIAADLLSQAEHGPDSQVILVTDKESLIDQVNAQLEKQIDQLPRKDIALKAFMHSRGIVFDSINTSIKFVNLYAPEHLIIQSEAEDQISENIHNAGSVFLGPWSPEAVGDYASGTNHTLPTNRYPRQYSGVSVESFMKSITYQKITREGLQQLGPVVEQMAIFESLYGHKQSVSIRLEHLNRTDGD